MSVLAAGFARADIPPRDPPPSKGCAVDVGAAGWVVVAVIAGLLVLRRRRGR